MRLFRSSGGEREELAGTDLHGVEIFNVCSHSMHALFYTTQKIFALDVSMSCILKSHGNEVNYEFRFWFTFELLIYKKIGSIRDE